jgi:endonuclease VIII
VDDAEGRSVSEVQRQPDEPDIRVVGSKDTPGERLCSRPDERRCRAGECGTKAHLATVTPMPEGDALHRAARRLQVLVGDELEVETPHPRAEVKALAPVLDGRRLESVEAIGKNLLLHFDGGIVLRSHLRMKGRWRVLGRDAPIFGTPWLVLRGERYAGVLFGGSVLELDRGVARRLGPDILGDPPRFDAMLERLRSVDQSGAVGDALLDQRLVAGIGNMWKAEALFGARVSPWQRLGEVDDEALDRVLREAHRLMKGRLDGLRRRHTVYRRVGRACPRCGAIVRSWPQGDGARMAYWCPACQPSAHEPAASQTATSVPGTGRSRPDTTEV